MYYYEFTKTFIIIYLHISSLKIKYFSSLCYPNPKTLLVHIVIN